MASLDTHAAEKANPPAVASKEKQTKKDAKIEAPDKSFEENGKPLVDTSKGNETKTNAKVESTAKSSDENTKPLGISDTSQKNAGNTKDPGISKLSEGNSKPPAGLSASRWNEENTMYPDTVKERNEGSGPSDNSVAMNGSDKKSKVVWKSKKVQNMERHARLTLSLSEQKFATTDNNTGSADSIGDAEGPTSSIKDDSNTAQAGVGNSFKNLKIDDDSSEAKSVTTPRTPGGLSSTMSFSESSESPSKKAASRQLAKPTGPNSGRYTAKFKAVKEMKAWRTPKSGSPSTGEFLSPRKGPALPEGVIINESNAQQYYTTDACLFVANLATWESDEEIKDKVVEFLIKYGPVYVKVNRDKKGNPLAFAQFTRRENAEKALKEAKGAVLSGRPLRIEKSNAHCTYSLSRYDSEKFTDEAALTLLKEFGTIRVYHPTEDELTKFRLRESFCVLVTFSSYQCGRDAVKVLRDSEEWFIQTCVVKKAREVVYDDLRYARQEAVVDYITQHSVCVRNLTQDATEESLGEFFKDSGLVRSIQMEERPSLREGCEKNYFAFVEFFNAEDAHDAIFKHNGRFLDGERLSVQRRLPTQIVHPRADSGNSNTPPQRTPTGFSTIRQTRPPASSRAAPFYNRGGGQGTDQQMGRFYYGPPPGTPSQAQHYGPVPGTPFSAHGLGMVYPSTPGLSGFPYPVHWGGHFYPGSPGPVINSGAPFGGYQGFGNSPVGNQMSPGFPMGPGSPQVVHSPMVPPTPSRRGPAGPSPLKTSFSAQPGQSIIDAIRAAEVKPPATPAEGSPVRGEDEDSAYHVQMGHGVSALPSEAAQAPGSPHENLMLAAFGEVTAADASIHISSSEDDADATGVTSASEAEDGAVVISR